MSPNSSEASSNRTSSGRGGEMLYQNKPHRCFLDTCSLGSIYPDQGICQGNLAEFVDLGILSSHFGQNIFTVAVRKTSEAPTGKQG